VQDEVIYRCIQAGCARPLPRRVTFCPYCGAGQRPGLINPARAVTMPQVPSQAAPPQQQPPPSPSPSPPGPPAPPAVAEAPRADAPLPQAASPAARPPAAGPPPRPGIAAPPPLRRPVRLRYWLLALAALWLIWIYARPDNKKIEARIDRAVAMTNACNFNDAQSELIELRSTRATPQQLLRLQNAINAAVPACEKKRLRAKAWSDTMVAVESALAAATFEKARSRLAAFTRRWGEDAETRGLKDSIDARHAERLLDEADACLAKGERACTALKIGAAERMRRPELASRIATLRESLAQRAPGAAPLLPGAPAASVGASQQEQSARNLIADAERDIAQGRYKAAGDKMDVCMTMVDAGNRECNALKARAERLASDMLHCVAAGREWIGKRCR
jgi:hypothetical protein